MIQHIHLGTERPEGKRSQTSHNRNVLRIKRTLLAMSQDTGLSVATILAVSITGENVTRLNATRKRHRELGVRLTGWSSTTMVRSSTWWALLSRIGIKATSQRGGNWQVDDTLYVIRKCAHVPAQFVGAHNHERAAQTRQCIGKAIQILNESTQ